MVSRSQGLKYGQARRHAGTEANRLYTPLEISQALFKRLPVGVINPAIEKVSGESSIGIALKSCRGVERRSNRAGSGVHMPPGMDAKCLKLLRRIRLRCHTQSLLRGSVDQAAIVTGANRSLSLRQLSAPFQYLNGDCCFPPQVFRSRSVVRCPSCLWLQYQSGMRLSGLAAASLRLRVNLFRRTTLFCY